MVHGDGRFLGQLSLLTGQRPYLTARAVKIIGSRFDPAALALRAFAGRAHLPHVWIDLEDADDVDVLLASMGVRPSDTPIVVTPSALLRRPSPGEFAEHLGLTFRSPPGYTFDLVVVGSGPVGLAAAVYGASEGLETVSLDAVNTGGQAGASSRIENYVGFPNGISGGELTSRAAIQAQRLAVDERERFEGSGVSYAATDMEARECTGAGVIVVGGGNSAGQAAIYLAQQGSRVTICIRGEDLAKSMSSYLIERIDADPATEWLGGLVALDPSGFVLTDRALPAAVLDAGAFLVRDPLPFETSVAGVFAVGDVRHGSLKRVAAAVGEGAQVVAALHTYLADLGAVVRPPT